MRTYRIINLDINVYHNSLSEGDTLTETISMQISDEEFRKLIHQEIRSMFQKEFDDLAKDALKLAFLQADKNL